MGGVGGKEILPQMNTDERRSEVGVQNENRGYQLRMYADEYGIKRAGF
jgi:hypothetical protein